MADQSFDLKEIEKRMRGALAVLKNEFGGLRTGRASASLLDPIMVNAYGAKMPHQPGRDGLGAGGAHDHGLGVGQERWSRRPTRRSANPIWASIPIVDGTTLRLPIPEMNQERRTELSKIASGYAEQARISVRNVRRDGMDLLKRLEKDHTISEDEHHSLSAKVQDLTDKIIKEIDSFAGLQGKRNHAGLIDRARARPGQLPSPQTRWSEMTPPDNALVPEAAGPVPRHVAIIMDGNGRWAMQRGLPRAEGHRRGVESVRACVRAATELGIGHLTLYTFSSENWRRPQDEISDLMGLLKLFIRRDLAELHKQNVRIRVIGTEENVESEVIKLIRDAVEITRNNTGLNLTTAFNYGSRDEITRAARTLALKAARGEIAAGRHHAPKYSRRISTPPACPRPIC